MDELLSDFVTEASESLAELDTALLQLERAPDDAATLSTIFRLVHTIKGTCGFLGLPRLEAVSHAAEDILGRLRERTLPASPALISLVFAAVDQIKAIIATIAATGTEPPGNDATLIAALQALAVAAPSPDQAPPAAGAQSPATRAADTAGQTIRVSVSVLEDLMTLVSELVLTRNQLLQLARSQGDSHYTAPLQRLSHLTSDLQEGVMRTRMQPIGRAWNKLPRLVRDLARDLNKQISLQMFGEDTELDRQVLEVIRDPLTHMVRNCADHGLESTAVRRQAGKPEGGTIQLNAFHQGGHIIIEVSDDGAGLAIENIRARVLSQGLATEAELATMTVRQIQSFVFQPGFSTAVTVTAISGRGVGLDVVRTNIERIGGSVEMQSTAGRGTTLTIKIPLTLAIISALIVEAKGERFALPQTAVVELVRTQRADGRPPGNETATPGPVIELIDGTPVLRLRERLLPLIRLSDVLQLESRPGDRADTAGHCTVIVTSMGTSTIGIVVDRVFDTEEIVVKPTSPMLRHIAVFSGNTILGDGSIIMILDPNGIARSVGVAAQSERPGRTVAVAQNVLRTEDLSAMLLFRRTAMGPPCAVPLKLVARIEELAPSEIESSSGRPVMQYRGHLMPLIELDTQREQTGMPATAPGGGESATIPVLVFVDRNRCMGLMVHEIVDVVEDTLSVEVSGARAGLLGTAVIAGRVSDVIDAGYWLRQAWQDWFEDGRHWGQEQTRLLVVEDSAFFRHLLLPALSAAGYHVTAVSSAVEALALREAPEQVPFGAIISDIEMPDMDGLAFVRRLRSGGLWSDLPVIALSGKVTEADVACGREAGFTDYVAKFDRDTLLRSLRTHLPQPRRMAA